jgi:nucleotide-binding universal stress UspA family protein
LVLHAGSESDGPVDAQARRRNIEEILAGWKEDNPDVLVQVEVVAGDPADAIRDHADHAGLMVVGRAHQRRFRSWSQSVASAVLDHCRCPLVIAPEASTPDLDQRAEVHPTRTVPVPQP